VPELTSTIADELASPPVAAAEPRPPRARPRWPGILSFVFGLLTVAGLVGGIVLATSDLFELATWVAWTAIGASALASVLGLVGVIGRLGRGFAAAGLALGIIANPYVLTTALDLIGGLWA
jgi:hypothetical protein